MNGETGTRARPFLHSGELLSPLQREIRPNSTTHYKFDLWFKALERKLNQTDHIYSRPFSLLTHVFGGEHVADHDALVRFGGGRGDVRILPLQFPSRHQHHNVVNVCDVRDHLQSVIHHCFLGEKRGAGGNSVKRQDKTGLNYQGSASLNLAPTACFSSSLSVKLFPSMFCLQRVKMVTNSTTLHGWTMLMETSY